MKLMKATEFRRKYYSDSTRPSRSTVYRWINNGTLPGLVLEGSYYVDIEAFEKMINHDKPPIEKEPRKLSKDTLLILARIRKIKDD